MCSYFILHSRGSKAVLLFKKKVKNNNNNKNNEILLILHAKALFFFCLVAINNDSLFVMWYNFTCKLLLLLLLLMYEFCLCSERNKRKIRGLPKRYILSVLTFWLRYLITIFVFCLYTKTQKKDTHMQKPINIYSRGNKMYPGVLIYFYR